MADRPASHSAAVECLSRCLYERLEHLDPGANEFVEWPDLRERARELYRHCIRGVFDREPEAAGLVASNCRSATATR